MPERAPRRLQHPRARPRKEERGGRAGRPGAGDDDVVSRGVLGMGVLAKAGGGPAQTGRRGAARSARVDLDRDGAPFVSTS